MYTSSLWCKFKKQSLKSVNVAYNNSFRILHKLPSCCSASFMFVSNHIKSFNELIHSSIYTVIPLYNRWSGSMTSKRVISEARYRFCRQREPASMSMLHWWLKMQYGAPLSTKTGSDQPCLLWIYCLNKTDTKPEVQMRIFIWNINTNPFPHLKTAHGQPTATAPGSRLRSKFIKLTDHLCIPLETTM